MKSYNEIHAQLKASIDLAVLCFKLTQDQQVRVLIKVITELTFDNERVDLAFVCALRDVGFACETTAFSEVFGVENMSKSTQK